MQNHLGLVIIENNKLIAAEYYASKFERELGDVINYDGVKYQVGVIGKNKISVVEALNSLIAKQNKINRENYKKSDAYKAKMQGEQMFNNTFNKIFNDIFFK